MTALFVLTVVTTKQQVLVRARCLSCARNKAADEAGGEGPLVWMDPNQSTVELLRPDGKAGVIMRGALL
jgi:hypothetical protein